MKIYIIHQDVAHEYGEVLDVCPSRPKAEVTALRMLGPRVFHPVNRDDISIEVWEFGKYLHTLVIDVEGSQYLSGAYRWKIE